jgi:hypothetical protein
VNDKATDDGFVKLRNASSPQIEFLYSENPSATIENGIDVSDCKRIKIEVPKEFVEKEGTTLFIRAVSPYVLEWAIGCGSNILKRETIELKKD